MEKRELCFKIEGKNLYLDQVLVEYKGVPIFFLCSEENQYYIVLCTDVEKLNYIVERVSMLDIYHLLHGEISMRYIILKQAEYWDIRSNEKVDSDVITKKSIKTLSTTLLPEENARFKILTREMQLFVEHFDRKFFKFIKV